MANFSNGDFVLLTTAFPGGGERSFYGLKENGEFFFEKEKSSISPYFTMIVPEQDGNGNNAKYESEIIVVTIKGEDDEAEYLLSISLNSQYCELYDFQAGNIYQVKSSSITGKNLISGRMATENLELEDNNYIIFSSWTQSGDSYTYKIKRLFFSSKNIESGINSEIEYSHTTTDIPGNSVSCFITNSKNIMCFNFVKDSSKTDDNYSNIILIMSYMLWIQI